MQRWSLHAKCVVHIDSNSPEQCCALFKLSYKINEAKIQTLLTDLVFHTLVLSLQDALFIHSQSRWIVHLCHLFNDGVSLNSVQKSSSLTISNRAPIWIPMLSGSMGKGSVTSMWNLYVGQKDFRAESQHTSQMVKSLDFTHLLSL